MEEIGFTTDNLINFSIDFKRLAGSLSLLYQHSRMNSLNIENLNKNIADLTNTAQDLSNSLKYLSKNVEGLETFKELSSNKQKNIETHLKYVEDQFSHSLRDLQSRLPEIIGHFLGEVDRVRSEQKTSYSEIEKKVERNFKHSKTSALQALESFRNELNSKQEEGAGRDEAKNKEKDEKSNLEIERGDRVIEHIKDRVSFIEENLKRVMFEDKFEPSYDKEILEKLKNKEFKGKSDMALEVNAKYLHVISEVAKLRDMFRSFSNIPGENSLDINLKHLSYSQRITNLENQVRELKDSETRQQDSHKLTQLEENRSFELKYEKEKPEKKLKKSSSISKIPIKICSDIKPVKAFKNKIVEQPGSQDFAKMIEEKVSFSQMEEFFKEALTQFVGSKSIISDIEDRIFKDLDTKDQTQLESKKPFLEETIETKPSEHPDLKQILSSINELTSKHQAETREILEKTTNEVKVFEAKLNKFSTGLQVQDLRTQDLVKRVQVCEEFQIIASDDLKKLQERFRKNTVKSSEELEKTLSHLQELEVIRTNIKEVMFKMNEGNKLHKRDYETIQELRQLLDSKTSKNEVDQKVDKNELKKMFRTLAKKIDKLQSDVKTIEESAVPEGLKKNEEPLIVAKKYASECLTCGRDISYQYRSMNKLPAHYKVLAKQQLPGFSKILPVLSSTLEMNTTKRQKSERFSITMQDSDYFPTISIKGKN